MITRRLSIGVHAFFELPATEREEIEREARDYVRSEFMWDKTAAEYFDLFVGKGKAIRR